MPLWYGGLPALLSSVAPIAVRILSSNAGERGPRANAECGNSIIKVLKLVAEKSATTFGDLPDCSLHMVFSTWLPVHAGITQVVYVMCPRP